MAKGNGTTRKGNARNPNGLPINVDLDNTQEGGVSNYKNTIATYPNGGIVDKYTIGEYNSVDIQDLEEIAKIKAKLDGSRVEILPNIDAENALYSQMFPDLKGTIYERRCPDLRITTIKGGKRYVEYESFERPFKPRDLSRMINRGSRQASSIIIDIRDTNITEDYVRRQIWRNLNDPDFKRPIKRVWTYDGVVLKKVWK